MTEAQQEEVSRRHVTMESHEKRKGSKGRESMCEIGRKTQDAIEAREREGLCRVLKQCIRENEDIIEEDVGFADNYFTYY